MWIIIIFSATLIDAIIERNERAGEEKKGMIGKIDFKTICILYSAQEEKISWAWRGGPRSSLYSTRWGTAPCSTRKEGRGPCSKTILTSPPFGIFNQRRSVPTLSHELCSLVSRISFNQIGGVWKDNPTRIPLTWRWDIFEKTPILENVYVVGERNRSPFVNFW